MTEKQLQDLIRTEVLTIQQIMNTATAEDRVALREDLGKIVAAASGVDAIKGMIKNRTAQQDAAEFLTPLIESIFADRPLQLVSKITITTPDYPQPIEKMESSPMPFIEIFGNQPIFSELVNNFLKTEQIEDYKAAKTGGNTEEKVQATRSLTLNVPTDRHELIFSLKRFGNDGQKIDKKITFHSITFNNKKYDITAFIVHQGSTLTAGHYITYIKEVDNCWYEYSDAKRTKIDKNIDDCAKQAYLVKYATSDAIAPQHQNGTVNADNTYLNRCWLNAALAFTNSLTTISKDNLNEVEQLKQSRKEILDNWSKNQQAVALEEFKDSEESIDFNLTEEQMEELLESLKTYQPKDIPKNPEKPIDKASDSSSEEQTEDDKQNKENLVNDQIQKDKSSNTSPNIDLQASQNDKYEGAYKGGLKHGQGKMIYASGDSYNGAWEDDLKHGEGKMIYADGDSYNGAWEDDLKHGEGKMIYADGRTYEGDWKKGVMDGEGIFIDNDKTKYIGSFKNNRMHGKGKFTSPNGATYEGDWMQGVMDGEGILIYKDKTKYIGSFKNNQKNGDGIEVLPNGASYNGKWKDNQKHGKGKRIYADGRTYEGDWMQGLMDGEGIFIDNDKTKYIGSFKNNQRHGDGKAYDQKNNLLYTAKWHKDQCFNYPKANIVLTFLTKCVLQKFLDAKIISDNITVMDTIYNKENIDNLPTSKLILHSGFNFGEKFDINHGGHIFYTYIDKTHQISFIDIMNSNGLTINHEKLSKELEGSTKYKILSPKEKLKKVHNAKIIVPNFLRSDIFELYFLYQYLSNTAIQPMTKAIIEEKDYTIPLELMVLSPSLFTIIEFCKNSDKNIIDHEVAFMETKTTVRQLIETFITQSNHLKKLSQEIYTEKKANIIQFCTMLFIDSALNKTLQKGTLNFDKDKKLREKTNFLFKTDTSNDDKIKIKNEYLEYFKQIKKELENAPISQSQTEKIELSELIPTNSFYNTIEQCIVKMLEIPQTPNLEFSKIHRYLQENIYFSDDLSHKTASYDKPYLTNFGVKKIIARDPHLSKYPNKIFTNYSIPEVVAQFRTLLASQWFCIINQTVQTERVSFINEKHTEAHYHFVLIYKDENRNAILINLDSAGQTGTPQTAKDYISKLCTELKSTNTYVRHLQNKETLQSQTANTPSCMIYCLDWAKAFTKHPDVLKHTLALVQQQHENNKTNGESYMLTIENTEFDPYLLRLAQVKKENYKNLTLTDGKYKDQILSDYFENHSDEKGNNIQATKKLDQATKLIGKDTPKDSTGSSK
jgi:hypothetical protein